MTYELGHAYVTILPSMNKFKKQFGKDMGNYIPAEGKKAGQGYGQGFWGGVAATSKKWAKRSLVGIGLAGGAVIGTALTTGFQRSVKIENAEATLSGLGYNEKEIEDIVSQALSGVKGTSFGLDDAVTLSSGALAAGITDVEGYIKSVGDVATITQKGIDETGAIFNKVMANNRLSGEEMNQLADAGIPILKLIQDEYGVTADEARKMVSSGKIDAQDFLGLMEVYEGAALKSGDTTQGSLANMKAALARLGQSMISEIFPYFKKGFQGITGVIDWATENVGKGVDAIKGFLGSIVSSDAVQGLIKLFRGEGTGLLANFLDVKQGHPIIKFLQRIRDFVTKDIPSGFKALGDVAEGVFKVFTSQGTGLLAKTLGVKQNHWIIKTLQVIRDTAKGLFRWILDTGIPAFAGLIDQFKNGEGFGGIFKTALDGVWTVVKDLFKFVKNTAVPAIQNFIDEFKAGEGAGGAFRDILESVWGAMKDAFGYVQNTVIPAISDMYDWMKQNKDIVALLIGAFVVFKTTMAIVTGAKAAYLAITTAVTVAQKALNTAMKANVIGIIVTAIFLLVGALVIAYQRHEGFRNLVNNVWNKIKEVTSSVVSWFKNTAWPWMRDALASIGNAAVGLYQNAIKPAWDKVKAAIDSVVKWIMNTAWPWMRDTFTKIADKATDLKDKAVNAFNLIKDGVSKAWDGAKKILDRFKSGLDSLKDKFTSVKDGIGRIWSTLGSALAKPINVVIETVNKFLNNVQEKLNDIPGVSLGGKWGAIPSVPVPAGTTSAASTAGRRGAGGAVMLAAGGQVPGWSPNDKADNIPAWLTAGEYVLPVKATERLRTMLGDDGLEHLRRGNLPGYAGGGSVGDGVGGVVGWAKDKWDDVIGFFENAKDWVKGVWNRLMPNFGDSWAGQAVKGVMGNIDLGKVANAVKEKVTGSLGGSNASGSGAAMPWQAIWSLVKSIAPEARMTSNYRPGARTAGYGNLSYHARGRAIDIVSGNMMATYQKVVGAMPWSEALFSPAGNRQVRNGRYYMETNPKTRADHWDHIHLAMAKGGLVPNLYDNGGAIPPGLSLVANQTGKPEQVLTDNQWQDIKQGGGNTIIVNGVKTDNAAQVAEEILFAQRRTGYGKYYRNR